MCLLLWVFLISRPLFCGFCSCGWLCRRPCCVSIISNHPATTAGFRLAWEGFACVCAALERCQTPTEGYGFTEVWLSLSSCNFLLCDCLRIEVFCYETLQHWWFGWITRATKYIGILIRPSGFRYWQELKYRENKTAIRNGCHHPELRFSSQIWFSVWESLIWS